MRTKAREKILYSDTFKLFPPSLLYHYADIIKLQLINLVCPAISKISIFVPYGI